MTPEQDTLSELEKCLLNDYQRGLPLSATPFADIADALGTTEAKILSILSNLQERGVISRVGPVFKPKKAGASTLAAVAVAPGALASVAAYISAFDEVNHNYERMHHFNLWFVVTASNQQRVEDVLAEIEDYCGQPVLNLPLMKHFHIDLGFPLWC
ncbi:Heme d1 biosynthesis protein NirD / Heme d1 biosynthesis protein NirL [hydrothermal vent metagenome]|uniref:siroheme decarboxylase n=1 Tax=hydrothermal vent metagenome TaxID=652676 RepID=A0A3B1B2C8_9ZZZZ